MNLSEHDSAKESPDVVARLIVAVTPCSRLLLEVSCLKEAERAKLSVR